MRHPSVFRSSNLVALLVFLCACIAGGGAYAQDYVTADAVRERLNANDVKGAADLLDDFTDQVFHDLAASEIVKTSLKVGDWSIAVLALDSMSLGHLMLFPSQQMIGVAVGEKDCGKVKEVFDALPADISFRSLLENMSSGIC